MTNDLRIWLYPLGVLPLIFFSARFLIQWLVSEWKGRSVVPKSFWILSLAGHTLMVLHTLVQLQFHVCITQACSGVISWRNLNLMGSEKRRVATKTAIAIMAGAMVLVTAYFYWEGEWFRAPQMPGGFTSVQLTWGWHLFGTIGIFLFGARFWIQWWQAETMQESRLTHSFWWISLVGNTMTLIYFVILMDPINCLGPIFAMVPYARNLVLLRKGRQHA